MKNTIIAIVLFIALFISTNSNAQVGIGVSTANINPSAQLDVVSTTKGLLPPRMTFAERNAIANSGAGLIIYCTNCGLIGEMQYYNGTNWMSMTIGIGALPITISTSYISGSNLLSTATCGGNISADGNATNNYKRCVLEYQFQSYHCLEHQNSGWCRNRVIYKFYYRVNTGYYLLC